MLQTSLPSPIVAFASAIPLLRIQGAIGPRLAYKDVLNSGVALERLVVLHQLFGAIV